MGSWVLARAPAFILVLTLVSGYGGSVAQSGGSWQAVLAAGDDAEPVFDDATRALARRLVASGVPPANIHRLSASSAELRRGVEPATAENLLRQIADLPARPGDHCFVFMTSHGEHDAGLWLARSQRALASGRARPSPVARLRNGADGGHRLGLLYWRFCRRYDGQTEPYHPDRGAPGSASFGCQVERTYTDFRSMPDRRPPHSANWQAVFSRTSRCVSRQEHARGELPLEPQAYLGSVVADMRVAF